MGCGSSFSVKPSIHAKKSPNGKVNVHPNNNKLPPIFSKDKKNEIREKNLEALTLICLDKHFDDNDKQLRAIIDYISCFHRVDQCEEYIVNLPKNNLVILIVSSEHFTEIISHIHDLAQLLAIYVFQDNQSKKSRQDNVDKHWTKRYSKVKTFMFENLMSNFFEKSITICTERKKTIYLDERRLL